MTPEQSPLQPAWTTEELSCPTRAIGRQSATSTARGRLESDVTMASASCRVSEEAVPAFARTARLPCTWWAQAHSAEIPRARETASLLADTSSGSSPVE
jgi:hypothetical protein